MHIPRLALGFSGRIGRAEYWRVVLFIASLLLLASFVIIAVATGVALFSHLKAPSRWSFDLSIPALIVALLVGVF